MFYFFSTNHTKKFGLMHFTMKDHELVKLCDDIVHHDGAYLHLPGSMRYAGEEVIVRVIENFDPERVQANHATGETWQWSLSSDERTGSGNQRGRRFKVPVWMHTGIVPADAEELAVPRESQRADVGQRITLGPQTASRRGLSSEDGEDVYQDYEPEIGGVRMSTPPDKYFIREPFVYMCAAFLRAGQPAEQGIVRYDPMDGTTLIDTIWNVFSPAPVNVYKDFILEIEAVSETASIDILWSDYDPIHITNHPDTADRHCASEPCGPAPNRCIPKWKGYRCE